MCLSLANFGFCITMARSSIDLVTMTAMDDEWDMQSEQISNCYTGVKRMW